MNNKENYRELLDKLNEKYYNGKISMNQMRKELDFPPIPQEYNKEYAELTDEQAVDKFLYECAHGTQEERRRAEIAKQAKLKGRVDGFVIGFVLGMLIVILYLLIK